jgi:hypothetical protein
MSCHDYEADIVDLARGALHGQAAVQRLRDHLAGCTACAARLAREEGLTEALREVARAAPHPGRSEEMERHLLAAFTAAHAPAKRQFIVPMASRRWLAAAAVLVLAVAAWMGSPWPSAPAATPVPGRPDGAPLPQAAPAASATIQAPPAQALARPSPASAARRPPRTASRRGAAGPGRIGPGNRGGIMQFVELPAAAGLPGIESGSIVRVELPMGILPAYGIDVVPEDAARVVEADVLVGQDGQPRAIRFVNADSDSRRRQ